MSKTLFNLINALQHKKLFDHATDRFELLETHISYVLLTGSYAYKFKKPVKFDFLDFSTLALRKFYCEEELRLNRRLAPELYLAVVAITGTEDAPVFNGQGEVLEYCVKMRQFPQQAQLDQVLEQGELSHRHIDNLAEQIAAFHQQIAASMTDIPCGKPEQISRQAMDNFVTMDAILPRTRVKKSLVWLQKWTEREYRKLAPLLLARQQQGHIRECHGDMHLRNMAILEDKLTIFDCIEFNPLFNWIDVASEIAFLLMDLDYRGYPHLAQRFLNRYLEYTGDYEALALLTFYRIYRSLVRAKVALLKYQQTGHSDDWQRGVGHILLARRYTETSTLPCLTITHGYSGSGKTWLTERLLSWDKAIRLRSDIERKRIAGLSALARTDSLIDEGIYRPQLTRLVYERLLILARTVLSAGYPVIVDATFLQREQRNSFRQLATELKVPFMILDCQAEESVLRARIKQRQQYANDASEATLAVLEHQLSDAEPLGADEQSFIS